MNYLGVLQDKIRCFREEIADIQELNHQFRRNGENGAVVQVVYGQRIERLQTIQHELGQLSRLGSEVVLTEQTKVRIVH